jgi:hypothetical protein
VSKEHILEFCRISVIIIQSVCEGEAHFYHQNIRFYVKY